jgi:multidrug resistance efflux pump
MTDQPAQAPEEELAHWHDELARVLKASPTLTWPNLIDWAEEAEHFALKACTKSGRARLARLEQQTEAAEAEVKRLTGELEQARAAKLAEAEPRLAAMEKLAAAWQKEAERARKDAAVPADMADVAEMRIWDALERPLTMEEVAEHIKILRGVRNLAVHAIEIASGTFTNAKKRVLDAAEAGPPSDTAVPGE